MTKYVAKQKRSERTNLQKAVLVMLATGMVAWPSFSPVYAANSVITDSNAQSLINAGDTTHNIYAQQQVNAAVGANKFTQFKVAQNEVANLHFTRWNEGAKGDNFHTLLNFVDARIEVNGTVNALRNNKIGGNLYFISSNGMIVGQSGAINAGALTVTVPQSAYLTGIMQG
ncbi:MAG: leukotoxin LktA family filamentous adhesin [Phascolarctobacterium sp.]|nr:leukotoxin LktA family filamentous adhesin [Candidatus Phascolarctobacterium caballi]